MRVQCGSVDDVCSYEKMKHQRDTESPRSAKLGGKKKTLFHSSASQSPPSAKLDSKKASSFRWIYRQSDSTPGSSKREVTQDAKESSISSASQPKKAKEPPKRIGFVDILLGYHSLLQASPAYPVPRSRKELHPTIGFIQKPGYGWENY